jgi:hypothetical protein
MANAEFIKSFPGANPGQSIELYLAHTPQDTWPGYDDSCPLGKRGYWLGYHEHHIYLGKRKPTKEKLAWYLPEQL